MSAVLESRIPQIIATSEQKAGLAVEKTVFDIEGGCKTRSRVDTGQMREDWRGVVDGLEGTVANSVEHVIHNEFGTESMPAQPMLTPSVEDARDPFYAAMGECYQ